MKDLGSVPSIGMPDAPSIDIGTAVQAGTDLAKSVALSDSDVKNIARQFIQHSDSKARVAASNSSYAKRLNRLIGAHTSEDSMNLNFKVYLSPQVNAFACADGSIRVYSGLMDMMRDDELRSVLGHEIGHVKLKHSDRATRLAYAASGLRKGVASANSAVGALASSELGGVFEKMLNAQFSQSQEEASDSYGLNFMIKHGYNPQANINALYKLASLEEKHGGDAEGFRLLGSHPAPKNRAKRLAQQYAEIKRDPTALAKLQANAGSSVPPVQSDSSATKSTGVSAARSPESSRRPVPNAGGVPPVEDDAFSIPSPVESSTGEKTATLSSATLGRSSQAIDSVAEPRVISSASWYVQLSAEEDRGVASSNAAQLESLGYKARVQPAIVRGMQYYRVLVGPFSDTKSAHASKAGLIRSGLVDGKPFVRKIE
jgi:putative metalloprotease